MIRRWYRLYEGNMHGTKIQTQYSSVSSPPRSWWKLSLLSDNTVSQLRRGLCLPLSQLLQANCKNIQPFDLWFGKHKCLEVLFCVSPFEECTFNGFGKKISISKMKQRIRNLRAESEILAPLWFFYPTFTGFSPVVANRTHIHTHTHTYEHTYTHHRGSTPERDFICDCRSCFFCETSFAHGSDSVEKDVSSVCITSTWSIVKFLFL